MTYISQINVSLASFKHIANEPLLTSVSILRLGLDILTFCFYVVWLWVEVVFAVNIWESVDQKDRRIK